MSLHARVALFAAVLAAVLAASTAGFISNEAVGASAASGGGVGRSLLQAKKDCPVNFEEANYTVITSRCKGPLYPPALCCQALKDFACPFTTYINDAQTTCAAAMFSYINLYGKYPPGLFANTCKEGANGLECPEDTPQIKPGEEKSASSSAAAAVAPMVALAAAVSAFLMLVMS